MKEFTTGALIAALTFIGTVFWMASLETGVRKDYADAGYIVIGKKAYRITPAEVQP